MTKGDFIGYINEYLDTCDDVDKEEAYSTQREFAETELDNFKRWLIEKGYL